MENNLRDDGEGYEYPEGTFLPDIRIDQEEEPSERYVPANRRRKDKGITEGDRGTEGNTKLDLIFSGHGMMIFGKKNQKPEDRSTVIILPGMNESTILEMGRLGMLTGRAMEIYKKLK